MLSNLWNDATGSWKTTLFGWLGGIPIAGPEILDLFGQTGPGTDGAVNWLMLIGGLAIAVGMTLTRDNDKPSEDVGADVASAARAAKQSLR